MFAIRYPVADLESRLVDLESRIAELRAEQGVIVRELDRANATVTDGSRSLTDWIRARLDVDGHTARDLAYLGTRGVRHGRIWDSLASGRSTFPRTVATMRLADTGATEADIEESRRRDLDGVRTMTNRRTPLTRGDERTIHAERFFVMQPTLDESRFRLWGQLGGAEGRIVEAAIQGRADELRTAAGDLAPTRAQSNADALVTIALDALDAPERDGRAISESGGATVTVFVDATRADADAAETATLAFGPRVGPATLEAILCDGTVRVIGLVDGQPVVASHATRAIPTAIRHTVMARDGGCTIDGCRSRYRLQPHHIRPWSVGGTHDPDNLTSLCWYHHHVAIHRDGYRIDPASPPHRRRLTRTATGTDPPRLAA